MNNKNLLAAVVAAIAMSSQHTIAQELSSNNIQKSSYDTKTSKIENDNSEYDEYANPLLVAEIGERISCEAMATELKNTREKCIPIIKGKNVILPNKSDCSTGNHSCAGQNQEAEKDAWLYVPSGVCQKILTNDFNDIPQDVKDKLNLNNGDESPQSGLKKVSHNLEPRTENTNDSLIDKIEYWFDQL